MSTLKGGEGPFFKKSILRGKFGTLFYLHYSEIKKLKNTQNLYDMKARNISYFKKSRAQKIMGNIMKTDLMTFLTATMDLCKSAVVKTHVRETLQELQSARYRLSA